MPFSNLVSATAIAADAFDGIVDDSISGELSVPGITALKAGVLRGCKGLTLVEFPEVRYAGEAAFFDCAGLRIVSLPNLKQAEMSLFSACESLEIADFPNLEEILTGSLDSSSGFLDECTSLKTIELPALTNICEGMFFDDSQLATAKLRQATSIGADAFHGCISLTSLTLGAGAVCAFDEGATIDSALYDTPILNGEEGAYLYVPSSLLQLYKNDENWSWISDQIRAIP